MMDFINQYAQLINIALLGTIIGWLFHISRLSRTALIDKYDAMLAAKDSQIQAFESRFDEQKARFEAENNALQHNLKIFEHLASLSKDEQVEALKIHYELKVKEIEEREKETMKAEEREALKEERTQLDGVYSIIKEIDVTNIAKFAQFMVRHLI